MSNTPIGYIKFTSEKPSAADMGLTFPQQTRQAIRQREAFYTGHGIHSVPAGQPPQVFEQALRQLSQGLVKGGGTGS